MLVGTRLIKQVVYRKALRVFNQIWEEPSCALRARRFISHLRLRRTGASSSLRWGASRRLMIDSPNMIKRSRHIYSPRRLVMTMGRKSHAAIIPSAGRNVTHRCCLRFLRRPCALPKNRRTDYAAGNTGHDFSACAGLRLSYHPSCIRHSSPESSCHAFQLLAFSQSCRAGPAFLLPTVLGSFSRTSSRLRRKCPRQIWGESDFLLQAHLSARAPAP